VAFTHTVVSYPDRGKWGDYAYRGNCSGYLIKDLIETYSPDSVFDPMGGSGTTAEVCEDLGIPCASFDLKQGYDILDPIAKKKMRDALQEMTDDRGVDMIFFHPPYWNMIQYSQDPIDFSNGPYSLYLSRMAQSFSWLGGLLSPAGIIAVLLGDLRRAKADRTYFLTDDCLASSTIAAAKLTKEIRIIKIQHNTQTSGETDLDIKFAHEYLTILRNARFPKQPESLTE